MVNIWPVFSQFMGAACALCGTPADGLCPSCRAALPGNDHACMRCALPLPSGAPRGTLCADCQARPPAYDLVVAPLIYDAPVDDLIGAFKYHHRLPLGRLLAGILADALRGRHDLPSLLLPIPAAPGRLRERGFNQAAELARALNQDLEIAYAHRRLIRVRDADRQRGLGRRQRQRNLHGAFAWRGDAPPHVALIDDVMTTGTTVEAASRVLKKAGVECVEVWAVARTPRTTAT